MPKREKKKLKGHEWRHIENKKLVYTVYFVLRLSVVLMLVAQFFNQNYENVLLCVLTLVLFMLPSAFERRLHIDLPDTLEIIILLFIYAAEILGEIQSYYTHYQGWDTMLHTMNGFLCAAIGFALVDILNREEKVSLHLSPFFMAVTAFCFSMTIGVLWEFFEFGMDRFFHMDMQRDTVINAIYSASLDVTRSNKVVAVPGIQEVLVNGESLGLGGYLDIGLIDTMKDLFVNFIGAVVFSVTGFFYAKSKGKSRGAALSFVPSRKTRAQDYLRQAQEENGVTQIERNMNGYALLFAEIPADGAVSDISDGFWIFVPDLEAEKALNAQAGVTGEGPMELRVVLRRTDDPNSSASARVTSQTLWTSFPELETLPQIALTGEGVQQ